MSSEWSSEGEDSEATFSEETKQHIHGLYRECCAICLQHLPEAGFFCSHLIASPEEGEKKIELGIYLGLIESSYDPLSEENGFLLCGTCHLGYFTLYYVTLSPPPIVLRYILQAVHKPENFARPVYEICQSLVQASHDPQNAPDDMKDVLPYVGLYSLVTLKPDIVRWGCRISSQFPPLSTIENFQFVPACSDADPDSPDNARIFDPLSITPTMPISPGIIPLTDAHSEEGYTQKRYWRLPLRLEAVLTELIARTNYAICHPWDSEQYYAVRIRNRCATVKCQREDIEFCLQGGGEDEEGGALEVHAPADIHAEVIGWHHSTCDEKPRIKLHKDDIIQWATDASWELGTEDDGLLLSPPQSDVSEYTTSSTIPQDSSEWEFEPDLSSTEF